MFVVCFTGNKNMLEHTCQEVVKQQFDQVPFRQDVPKQAVTLMKEACIDFCLLDMKAFLNVENRGYHQLFQRSIDIGNYFGRLNASEIIPHRTTVSRGVQKRADGLRLQLHPEFIAAMQSGNCSGNLCFIYLRL